MAIVVHINPGCEAQAKKHGQLDVVRRVADEIERKQSIDNLDKHLPSPVVEKHIGRSYRLYGVEILHRDGEHRVVCFSEFFAKGEKPEFHRELEDERTKAAFIAKSAIPEVQRDVLIRKKLAEGVKERLPVSEAEQQYLKIARPTLHQDEQFIFESRDWVECLRKGDAREFLRTIAKHIYDLLCLEPSQRCEGTRFPKNSDHGLLYRQFKSGLFLVGPLGIPGAASESELRERYSSLLEGDENATDETLRKNSIRAYPESVGWIVDIWVNVQKGERDANLALSPEESELLSSILTPGKERNKYPLFINGRPGSGKTTILQYLFSDLLDFHLNSDEPLPNPPLYLTYSTALLDRARKTVANILKCDYRRQTKTSNPNIDGKEGRDAFNRSFNSFRGLMLEQLDSGSRSRYLSSGYVDFPRFRNLWARHVARDNNIPSELRKSPELAWHAIRTFIKGHLPPEPVSDDSTSEYGDFTPERYLALPKRQKSIDEDVFRAIYQKIWHGWYRKICNQQCLWDDQDLAMEVLRLEADISKYPVIFCDEAQDFTSNELAVILKLSLFSSRAVPNHYLSSIPFAFAGDPFQTLNPTGFDWNALSDGFRENILSELDPLGRHKLKINFQELSYNYRSAEPIVRLCNLVQLIRGLLFDISGLSPQQTWKNEAAAAPSFFEIEELKTTDALRAEENLVIIVPTQDESEGDYIKEDATLKAVALRDGEIVRDIFSPMRAKGMEFQRVAVYKFGDYCIRNHPALVELLTNPHPTKLKDRDRLAFEYFVNRLYVAISRARSRLLIVDTRDAMERFWKFAGGTGYDQLIKQYRSKTWKSTDLGSISSGEETFWSEEKDDPKDLGDQYYEIGINSRDSYTLDRAEQKFLLAGEGTWAAKAKAWSRHFREEYFEAAEIFEKIGDVGEALENYWLAESFKEYVALARRKKSQESVEFELAAFMAQDQGRSPDDVFGRVVAHLEQTKSPEMLFDGAEGKIRRQCLDAVLSSLLDCLGEGSPTLAAAYGSVTEISRLTGWNCPQSLDLAVLASMGGDCAGAVAICEKLKRSPDDLPEVLLDCFAEIKPFPERVSFLLRRGRIDDVLMQIRDQDATLLTPKIIIGLAEKLWTEGQFAELMELADLLPGKRRFLMFDGFAEPLDHPVEYWQLFGKAIENLCDTEDWKHILEVVTKWNISDMSTEKKERLRSHFEVKNDLNVLFVRRVAHSVNLEKADIGIQRLLTDYMEKKVVKSPDVARQLCCYELGRAVELTEKFSLCLDVYEGLMKELGARGDGAGLRFARERWLMSKIGYAQYLPPKDKRKRRMEEEYKGKAKEWRIDWTRLERFPALENYKKEIERFYEGDEPEAPREIDASTLAPVASVEKHDIAPEGSVDQAPVSDKLPMDGALVAAAPAEARLSGDRLESSAYDPNSFSGFGSTILEPRQLSRYQVVVPVEREDESFIMRSGRMTYKVECYYGAGKISILEEGSKHQVILKKASGSVKEVQTFDELNIVREQDGIWMVRDWQMPIEVSPPRNGHVEISIGLMSGGARLLILL
jgi:hypothetical protein